MAAPASKFPWLLYAYPWMPFPRRVIIYLREKRIPSSLVTVVRVSDPQQGDEADPKYPPRPSGSLPILVIPPASDSEQPTHIRQSLAIMNYLDELCDAGALGFPQSPYLLRGQTALERARITELVTLADELNSSWNPVRLFGTGAGPFTHAEAAKESLRWIKRTLSSVEKYLAERDMRALSKDGGGQLNMGDIVLYQFLEFTRDCYGKDVTAGTGEQVKDVYGRSSVESYSRLQEFFKAFSTRSSAARVEELGEMPTDYAKVLMTRWADGVKDELSDASTRI